MKILMYPHAGSGNHGCEAIVKTTADFINGNEITLVSANKESDVNFGLSEILSVSDAVCDYPQIRINSVTGIINRAKAKLFRKDIDDLMIFSKYKKLKDFDVALSIGGDNYCYPGMIYVLNEFNKTIDNYKIPRILWGCSLDENLLTKDVLNDLKRYKAIFVRESVSKKILKDNGLTENVYLFPDPAFTLKKTETFFPVENFGKNGVIGLNLSPLMKRFMPIRTLQDNYRDLVEYIIRFTNRDIALIPHVNQKSGNSDYEFMTETFKDYNTDRILLLGDNYTCQELKSLISQCEVFVGCRTHATIAAYSSCVPTLVVGYSNKSKGIAKDIFGNQDNYVISGNDINSKDSLTKAFVSFYNKKNDIKKYLIDFMPSYIKKSEEAGQRLNQIIKNYI